MRRLLILTLLAAAMPALADDAAPAKAAVPPPPTVTEQVGPEPEVRIVQQGDKRVEEYRINGKLYMVKVTPAGGAPYYLMDDDGSGKMKEVDPRRRVIIPQWVLLRF